MMKHLIMLVLTTVVSVVHSAPSISIGKTYEFIEANARTLTKGVKNSGTSTAFVRVELVEITYDGAQAAERPVLIVAPHGSSPQATLIASPARMIIPAGSTQHTRLLAMGPRDAERYYRVRFIPVIPQQSDAFALTNEEREQYADEMSASLTFMAAFGAILVVRPATPVYDTRLDDSRETYRVRNAGNTMVMLDDLMDCDMAGRACSSGSLRRVVPGGQITIQKRAGRSYRSTLIEGERHRPLAF
ncbi:MAG: hypothetical protein JHC61_02460 [Burkholderiaceae bacterium]|nr:hypothetical protein [Burkholderiaceae bacterium]